MSSDVVIRAEGLGKKYMIGHQSGERYASLRDVMAQTARNFARTAGDMFRGKAIIAGDEVEEFWALKDVSFEVKRGDVVGVIGRNGAGKSTLLKVLSRITEPSEGRVEIKGRAASLLEVGTGFHPELSGRENIYLNGAILGMSREEIKRKFDEIVDFSGVEKFLDTPVKRYSSGMYVRLAFAVAAHLEPEILIVDEVLAVGDAEFQKKCLGKMQDVAGEGRTVLFVSHNMAAMSRLCRKGIFLSDGRANAFDTIAEAQLHYNDQNIVGSIWEISGDAPYEGFSPLHFSQKNQNTLTLRGIMHEHRANLVVALKIESINGDEIFWTTHKDCSNVKTQIGGCEFEITIPSFLKPGEYRAIIAVFFHDEKHIIDVSQNFGIKFVVAEKPIGSSFFDIGRSGVIQPLIEWSYAHTDVVS